MPKDPWGRKTLSKRRPQPGDLAGTVDQTLRDRRQCLSRLPKRQDDQNGAAAPLSMQQPSGVFQMRTFCNENPLSPVSCEKSILLRHVILLPKIDKAATYRSSVGQSTTMSAPVTDQYRDKREATKLFTHLLIDRKNKKEMIETP